MNELTGKVRTFGEFRFDSERLVLWHRGEPVGLQRKEAEILAVLTEQPGQVVTKNELLERVWPEAFVQETNLSRHVYRLRRMFASLGDSEDLIRTVPRCGYRFTGDVRFEEFVLTRHSVSRTIVEEIEDIPDPLASAGPARTSPLRRAFAVLGIALAVFTVALAAIGLTSSARSSASSIRTVAVLPPLRIGDGADAELGLGFADAVITSLGSVKEVKTISLNAVSDYSGEQRDPVRVGALLGADAVFDGTVQRSSGSIRVTLRLIRVADGEQVWAGAFDESDANIFRLQDLMATQAAGALAVNLNPREGKKRPTANLEAYHAFLQGQYLLRRRETLKSTAFLRRAVELDRDFAKAWANLAAAQVMMGELENSESSIRRALESDPDLADAHAVDGFIRMFAHWDWPGAKQALDRAVELDSNSVEAWHWRGIWFSINGRYAEAKADIGRALDLYPISGNLYDDLGQVHFFAREFDEAERLLLKARELDDRFGVQRLMELYELQGREKEAYEARRIVDCRHWAGETSAACVEHLDALWQAGGWEAIRKDSLAKTLTMAGKRFDGFDANIRFGAAIGTLGSGRPDEALRFLQESMAVKRPLEIMNYTFPFVAANPRWDPLRDDPRFLQLIEKIGLPSANFTEGG